VSSESSHSLQDVGEGKRKIRSAFTKARDEGRGALIGYLMAGDPASGYTPALCRALIDGGVDILELGIPFSDPIADGPTIQAASFRSINAGTTPDNCLEVVQQLKGEKKTSVPIVFLSYYNTIFRFGLGKFLSRARSSGVDGLVVPDLPQIGSSEFSKYIAGVGENDLASILLATPTTTDERLRSILANSTGFLYLVSLLGVTGVRNSKDKKLEFFDAEFIRHCCEVAHSRSSPTPVAVGFGISEPRHVQNVLRSGADGAIVGSALVNIVSKNLSNVDLASKELERFVRSLHEATYLK
jgi:tryptophan synthase alpha chain